MRLAVLGRGARPVSVRNPLCDLVVPLLFGLAIEQSDDSHGHVVTAHAAGLAVGGQAVVHHVLANPGQLLLGGDPPPHEFDYGLRRLAVPDTYSWISIGGSVEVGP